MRRTDETYPTNVVTIPKNVEPTTDLDAELARSRREVRAARAQLQDVERELQRARNRKCPECQVCRDEGTPHLLDLRRTLEVEAGFRKFLEGPLVVAATKSLKRQYVEAQFF